MNLIFREAKTIPTALPAELKKPASLVAKERELAHVRDRIRAVASELHDIGHALTVPVLGHNADRNAKLESRQDVLNEEREQLAERHTVLTSQIATESRAFTARAAEPLQVAYVDAATRYADALHAVQLAADAFMEGEKALRDIGIIIKKPLPLAYAKQIEASVRDIIRGCEASAA